MTLTLPIPPCVECGGQTWEIDLTIGATLMVDASNVEDGPELLMELADYEAPICCAACGEPAPHIPGLPLMVAQLWQLPTLKVILQKVT